MDTLKYLKSLKENDIKMSEEFGISIDTRIIDSAIKELESLIDENVNKIMRFPAMMVRGTCPSKSEYSNDYGVVWNHSYFKEKYEPYGWRYATNEEILMLVQG